MTTIKEEVRLILQSTVATAISLLALALVSWHISPNALFAMLLPLWFCWGMIRHCKIILKKLMELARLEVI